MNSKIINRILGKIEIPDLIEALVDRISFGELQSLLMEVFSRKARNKQSKDIFNEFQLNRFTTPSDIDPKIHRRLELDIFSLVPDNFEVIDLSPLTPLGTSSVLTTVHQNNIISTIRNTEVAADTTNILALECAKRRRLLLNGDPISKDLVKLCSSQRCTRGQPFENENFSPYFNVVALCTSGPDEGNDRFEITQLEEHIRFYLRIIEELIEAGEIRKVKIKFYDYAATDNSRLIENIRARLSDKKNIDFVIDKNSDFGRNYYSRLRFMISVTNHDDQEFDYIDGGFTDWTSKLLNNRKERLLTSGIGTDFLLRTVKTIRIQ